MARFEDSIKLLMATFLLSKITAEELGEEKALETLGKWAHGIYYKTFGDKKKQLEDWEAALRGEEYKIQQSKTALDNREKKLQDKEFEIQTDIQVLQTKKEELAAKEKIIADRDAELQELGAKLLDRVRDDTSKFAKVEQDARFEGRQMVMVLAPR